MNLLNFKKDQDSLVENTLSELRSKVVDVLLDGRVAPALERLFPLSTPVQLLALLSEIVVRAEDACASGSGSRAVESLLSRVSDIFLEMTSSTTSVLESLSDSVKRLFTALEAISWFEASKDVNGSHVIRAIIQFLSKLKSTPFFRGELQRVSANIVASYGDQIASIICHPYASPTLQSVLDALSPHPAFVGAVAEKIVDGLNASHSVETAVRDVVGSRLVEKVLDVAPNDVFAGLYTSWFRGRLSDLCKDRIGNHIVQKLLSSPRCAAPQASLVITEILPLVPELLSRSDRAGVVMQAAECASRLQVCEPEICSAVKSAVGGSSFAVGLLKSASPAYVASRTAQAMLRMKRDVAKVFAGSLLALPKEFVVKLAMDNSGSHVIEAAISSSSLPVPMRQKVTLMLVGDLAEISMSAPGSRVVEKCYAVADIAGKEVIAGELAESEAKLKYDFNGRFVLRACKVELFREKKESWRSGAKKNAKRVEMFQDIIGDQDDSKAAGSSSLESTTEVADTLGDYEEFMQKLGFGHKTEKKEQQQQQQHIKEEKSEDERPKIKDEIEEMFKSKPTKKSKKVKEENPKDEEEKEAEKKDELSKTVVELLSNSKKKKQKRKLSPSTTTTTSTTIKDEKPAKRKKFSMF